MNDKKTSNKIKVVLTVGDESGVGPEIILKVLSVFLIFIKGF